MNGPSVADHGHANVNTIQAMSISPRATKAEILAHCQALQAQVDDGPDWQAIGRKLQITAATVSRETVLLVRDIYRAGAIARQWFSRLVAELSAPVLR